MRGAGDVAPSVATAADRAAAIRVAIASVFASSDETRLLGEYASRRSNRHRRDHGRAGGDPEGVCVCVCVCVRARACLCVCERERARARLCEIER
jgi:hypothetical protein